MSEPAGTDESGLRENAVPPTVEPLKEVNDVVNENGGDNSASTTDHPGEVSAGGDPEAETGEFERNQTESGGEPSDDEEEYNEEEVYKLKSHRRAPKTDDDTSNTTKPAERRRRPKSKDDNATKSRSQRSHPLRQRQQQIDNGEDEQNPPEEEEDEATRERRLLEAKIDAALQPSSKRRKKVNADDLEMLQDDLIARLRDKMREAALQDVESIREGQPAVHKVRMLPEVVAVLQKSALAESILDGNLLESVRIWLEPLPDASLPSFEIQKVLFSALVQLPIKTIHLRESGLGRVVLFYQKSKRPQPSIKRLAQKLIGDWTRPIIGRSDNYRDKRVATASFDPLDVRRRSGTNSGSGTPKTPYEESAARRNRAAIPTASGISYMVAPVSSGSDSTTNQGSGMASVSGGGSQQVSQLRRMKTKLMASGKSGRKKSQVSVEGKDLH